MVPDLIEAALRVCTHSSPEAYVKLAKATIAMLQEDTFQKVM